MGLNADARKGPEFFVEKGRQIITGRDLGVNWFWRKLIDPISQIFPELQQNTDVAK